MPIHFLIYFCTVVFTKILKGRYFQMHTEITFNELVSLTEVQPRHGGIFVADFLQRQQLTITEAAKLVGCARSTLHRFIKGGNLTPELAAQLHQALGLSIPMLFNLEAQYKTYLATHIIE
jgi:plasmid maintenance system antidote protein VapI